MTGNTFGEQLRTLYVRAGFTQETLAEAVGVSSKSISRWVNGERRPQRHWFDELCAALSPVLTRETARLWAAQGGYTLTDAALDEWFGAETVRVPYEALPLPAGYVPPPEAETLRQLLAAQTTVAISGGGGVGKTTLAAWACRALADDFPDGVIWVSVPEIASVWTVQARLARVWDVPLPENPAERAAVLRTLYHGKRCLVVLDGLWAAEGLEHLRVIDAPGRLLATTRDRLLGGQLGGATLALAVPETDFGKRILRAILPAVAWPELSLSRLVSRLGGVPLALRLAAGLIQSGLSPDELLGLLRRDAAALDDDGGLTAVFHVSLAQLAENERRQFAALGVFHGDFSADMAGALWQTGDIATGRILRRLVRFNLVEKDRLRYRLLPLTRDFARRQSMPAAVHRRHAAYFIRHKLFRPQIVDGATAAAPPSDEHWADVVAAVRWSTLHAPEMAAMAAIVAHTDRPALVQAVGAGWSIAVTDYLSGKADAPAFWWTAAGELELSSGQYEAAETAFAGAVDIAKRAGDLAAASYNLLRRAGAVLLANDPARAAQLARDAVGCLQTMLPFDAAEIEAVKWVFYWFDMVYTPLVRWQPLPEADVMAVETLGTASGVDTLAARGHHLRRIWYTAPGTGRLTPETRPVARALAVRAACRWRRAGEYAKADDEASWAGYRLTGRYSRQAAERYARRRSAMTPVLSKTAIAVQPHTSWRWWLEASETQRVGWLSRMLRRSLAGETSARAERWLAEILRIGILGRQTRRPVAESNPPAGHLLNGVEWAVLRGETGMPVIGRGTAKRIEDILSKLDADLGETTVGKAAD